VFEIGNSLREARLRQGYELPRVEADTKIRAKYLRALEEERFEVLPGETYVKGFLRTYSEYLGLDGQLYVDEFNSRFTREEEPLAPPRPKFLNAARFQLLIPAFCTTLRGALPVLPFVGRAKAAVLRKPPDALRSLDPGSPTRFGRTYTRQGSLPAAHCP